MIGAMGLGQAPFDMQMIDEAVMNEPMMWLTGGSAQMEANIGQKQKVDGRSDKDRSDDWHGL